MLVLDGVFREARPGQLTFRPAPPPSDEDVAQLLATVRARVKRLLARRQLEPEDDSAPPDPLSETSPVLAGRASASVQSRVALGPRAGARVRRVGDEPELDHVSSRGPRQAQLDGFDLHANVWVTPNDRARLEQLCRYLLRPPLAQDHLQLRPGGRVLVKLKTVWRDGTSHLLFELIELLEKLAAIMPRPAINLVRYYGVLAPHARWRSHVVSYGHPALDVNAREREASPRGADTPGRVDMGRADAPRVRPRCPRLPALWRPAAGHRRRAGSPRRAGHPHPPCPLGRPRAARPRTPAPAALP